jgi:glycerophosphoryl diester phosphodiesterase
VSDERLTLTGLGATARELVTDVVRTLRGKVGPILVFEFFYRLLVSLAFTPLSVGILSMLIGTRGKPSIGNFEIAGFLLSWPGILSMVLVGAVQVTQLYFHIAGLVLIMRPGDDDTTLVSIIKKLIAKAPRLFFLGLYQMAAFVALLFPSGFLTIGLLSYLWSNHDIYGLVILRPPVFWIGVALGGLMVSVSVFFIMKFFLRWFLALPEQLLNPAPVPPIEAMRLSNERTRDHKPNIIAALAIWAAFQSVLAAAVLGFLRWSADAFLDYVGLRLAVALPATVIVLVVHYIVITMLAVVGVVGFTTVILYLDRKYSIRNVTDQEGRITLSQWVRAEKYSTVLRHPAFLTILLFAFVLPIGSALLINQLDVDDRLEVIAHRAGGAMAPENTVAAVKKAIEVGAQWSEIDVQFTSDKAVVVIHDMDLRRLAGLNKSVKDCTLAEVKALDVGNWFSPKFKGEKIPTLDEFLDAAKDRMHVLIELKVSDPDEGRELARAVLEILRRRGETARHRLCSQSYESVVEAKRLQPDMTVGFIAAQSIGRMQELTVDFFMLSVDLSTKRFVERAKVVGKGVYSWTIKNPDLILPLMDRGVAAIISDDPAPMMQRLEEIRALSNVERLILRARDALAD